jgi:methylenetetrahydrofolate dehydrogenase (NADP+)/methenyltetrahydrofolate cyclohydrolase
MTVAGQQQAARLGQSTPRAWAPLFNGGAMTAAIIDGHQHAQDLLDTVAVEIGQLSRAPGLAVVLVGDDPASHIYVRGKIRIARKLGLHSETIHLPGSATEGETLSAIAALNARRDIDGILVQLPLPAHINVRRIMVAVDPDKDVDGLHALNAGRLLHGADTLVPCTPSGCLKLIKSAAPNLTGCYAVIIGGSNIVGKPMAALLLEERATVTQTHIHTRDTPICRSADILVSAVGKPGLVRGDCPRPSSSMSAPRASRNRTAATSSGATSRSTRP